MRKQRNLNNSRAAAIMVEAALVMPLLAIIIFATAETCQRIFEVQSLTIAASEAARVAIIPDASLADVQEQAAEIAEKRNLRSVTVNVEPADFKLSPVGTFVRVTVTADVDNYAFAGLYMPGELSASVSMMIER